LAAFAAAGVCGSANEVLHASPTPGPDRFARRRRHARVAFGVHRRRGHRLEPGPGQRFNGHQHASDFLEIKNLGRATGSTRTPEQTAIAWFWIGNTVSHWNRIAATIALHRRNKLSENARLFALLNIAIADAGIAVWDAKFLYRFWRPFTAVPLADSDNNPLTIADGAWTPLLATPNHQEYPSGHGGLSGAAARILALFFGDRTRFTHRTDTAPFAPRTHDSVSEAADEANNSRVYGGIHFRTAVRHGRIIGDQIGLFVFENLLRPIHGPRWDGDDEEKKRK
jgi:hypothetical protein